MLIKCWSADEIDVAIVTAFKELITEFKEETVKET